MVEEMESKLLLLRTKENYMRERLNELRMWHENLTWEVMDWFGWDEYQMLWVAWGEGLILGLLLWWIF